LWLKIGLSTKKVDQAQATAAVKQLYKAGGQSEPLVMHFDSPAQCILAIHFMRNMGELPANLGANLGANLRANLGDNLWANLRDNLGANLGANLRANLRANLGANLRANLRANLGANLRANLGDNLRDNLRDNLGANLGANLGDNLWDNLWDNFGANLGANLGDNLRDNDLYVPTYFWGAWDAYWIAWAKFAEDIGVRIDRKEHFDAYADFVKTCGVAYLYPRMAFVSDRPEIIAKDPETRLHSETGPALLYRDGYSVHAWHGVNVPNEWIEGRDTLAPQDVLKCANVEQRAAGVAILGMDRMLDQLEHTIIDSDADPERGDLIRVKLPDLPEPGYYLRALCPRNGRIMEAVNNREMDEMTVRGAQAWRLGIPAAEFTYPEKRT
jgi:hypothetical protein